MWKIKSNFFIICCIFCVVSLVILPTIGSAAEIHIRAKDREGNPVEGVDVKLKKTNPHGGLETLFQKDTWRFGWAVFDVPDGSYVAVIGEDTEGFETARMNLSGMSGMERITITEGFQFHTIDSGGDGSDPAMVFLAAIFGVVAVLIAIYLAILFVRDWKKKGSDGDGGDGGR